VYVDLLVEQDNTNIIKMIFEIHDDLLPKQMSIMCEIDHSTYREIWEHNENVRTTNVNLCYHAEITLSMGFNIEDYEGLYEWFGLNRIDPSSSEGYEVMFFIEVKEIKQLHN
jgi:hypothetical protein